MSERSLCSYEECERETELRFDGEATCVFHAPLEAKREDEALVDHFREEFSALLESSEGDFRGFVIPDEFDLSDEEFRDGTNFSEAVFGDKISFAGSTFGAGSFFADTEFGDRANFRGAEFGDRTYFLVTKFGSGAAFRRAKFGDGVDFGGAEFGTQADFIVAEFGDRAGFVHAQFGDGVDFGGAEFGSRATFLHVEFGASASFDGAKVGSRATFLKAKFGDDASFLLAQFGDGVEFDGAVFGDGVDFDGAVFGNMARFHGAKFGDGTVFLDAEFGKHADFSRAIFFGSAIIGGTASGARLDSAVFSKAEFRGPAFFDAVDLTGSRFWQVDLSRVSFLQSDIEDTSFINCTWKEARESTHTISFEESIPWYRWKRPVLLYDERLLRARLSENADDASVGLGEFRKLTKKDPEEDLTPADVEQVALQLKASLERSKDPIQAGEFHFTVMEMKRLAANSRWRRALLWLYKTINGYGERYGRSLLWLAILLVVASFIYCFSGLDVLAPGITVEGSTVTQVHETINWTLSTNRPLVSSGELVGDLWDSLTYALANVLPFRFGETAVRAGSPLTVRLAMVETLIGTPLVAFFLLSLRRRFQR